MSQLNNEITSFLMVSPVITLQELSISLCTEEASRICLSLDALKQSSIVPRDWEATRSSVTTNEFTQLSFTNGIRLINQLDSLTFIEPLISHTPKEIRVADLAHKYVNLFPHINFREVNISIRNFVTFESNDRSNKELVHQYMFTLLSSDLLSDSEIKPVTTVIDVIYSFAEVILNLKIKEVEVHLPNNQVIPSILFSGVVPHKIEATYTSEKLQQSLHFIYSWRKDLEVYTKILNKFLRQTKNN